MAAITGREIIAAFKKATSWRTAVECGSGDGVLITNEALGDIGRTPIADESLGVNFITERIDTFYPAPSGTLGANMRYMGLDRLIACGMGSTSTPTCISSGSDKWEHEIRLAPNNDGLFGTFVIKKKTDKVWEIPSLKVTGFTLNATVGEIVTAEISCIGNKWETESQVNSTDTIANVTYPDKYHCVVFDDNAKIRMNARDGSALSDSDKIYPHAIRLTFDRPMEENRDASYNDISEPTGGGFPTATLELTFDKYSMNDFTTAINSATLQKLDITFTDANSYMFKIEAPSAKIVTATAPVGGPGKIGHTVTLQLDACVNTPDGMPCTEPFMITLVNTRDGNILG